MPNSESNCLARINLMKENVLQVNVTIPESNTATAVLIPVPDGHLPEVKCSSSNSRWFFGQKMIAGGVEIVPLIVASAERGVSCCLSLINLLTDCRLKVQWWQRFAPG